MFAKEIGKDFFEGKVTLPIILLNQKLSSDEKLIIKEIFEQDTRSKEQFDYVLKLVKKYNIIKDCYKKAEHYISLASNSLSIFEDCEEKIILKNLTSFSINRKF